ncbi:hypothetical protein DWU98_03775 [Dyella monticola]|uniref:Uncharacterized protein n=1 Tax=Dyella monticola TaxID=1927958 RepID=A0A370XA14_9GAMM|nr:hypothetical protein [Dyella monticola]RDS85065.1 hypothetical protein DWU98_03775 [Dyella monticola]
MTAFENWIGFGLCILGVVLLKFIKGKEPWRYGNLLVGIALVLLASFAFGLFVDMGTLFDLLAQSKKIDQTMHDRAKSIAGVWAFVFPGVVAAIGANLITGWVTSKGPANAERQG